MAAPFSKEGLTYGFSIYFTSILGLAILLFSPENVQAQDSLATYKKWHVGVKGGASFSSISSTDEQITRQRPRIDFAQGIAYGAVIRYMTEKNFGLQIEVNYVEKGWREEFTSPDSEGRPQLDPTRFYRVNLSYLEVPILAHGYFGKRNLRIFATIGVYGGVLLSSSTQTAPSVDPNEITYEYLVPEQNEYDLGIRGGAGVAIVTKVGTFQVEGTYSLGLNSVLDRNRTTIPSILQNNAIVGSLGYLISF
ncbi:porin family protein [Tunicatimonas pelagia]|uniref:porin family protein n=1 Tax=Tunicatimonas pelagia TaxID=931531 RepID=UPI00266554EF|nr:porin family protein [Tunicatimonas pelagia]WKN45188.1 porin family protein [Tunicatimonas pelagia]